MPMYADEPTVPPEVPLAERQLQDAIYRSTDIQALAHNLGIRSLTVLIEKVLDEHYPADVFGEGDALYPSWAGERGGEDIDPGIKWCALLRHAIKQVER